jgi:acyl-coenzyme A synthetase/AMP-(fatty) acid ligase
MNSLNITDAVFAAAERQPQAVALIDGEDRVSRHALCRGVLLAARRFCDAGWRAGDVVGISLRARPAMHLLVSLALARSGITQIALPADEPADVLRTRSSAVGLRGLVCDHVLLLDGIAALAPATQWLTGAAGDAWPDDLREPGGERLWIIGGSSGTTGAPKLIGVSHQLEDEQGRRQSPVFGYRNGERFLNLTGLNYMTGIKRAIRCLSEGGTPVFLPGRVDTARLFEWIDRHNVRYLSCAPVHLHRMLAEPAVDGLRLPHLRVLRSTGSVLLPTTLEAVCRRITPNVYVDYGLNEVSTVVAATPALLAASAQTVGRPLGGVELQIVDAAGCPLPAGATGQVRVRGTGIQPCYLATPTPGQARMFRDGWCHTGDMGVLDADGLLFIKGRADEAMNFNGVMIWPAEIEAVLRTHPRITDAAAFALPSSEHQDVPVVAVVCADAAPLRDLEQYCRDRLGARAPRLFMRVAAIPRNAAGKILRGELAKLAQQRLQGGAQS